MFQRKPLSIAMATAMVASAGAMPTAVYAADDDQLIEEVVVTGSRIKRSTNTQSQEIITFTAEDMQLSGDISVSDALRSSTMNTIGSFRESSGSSAQSNATVNLRGTGAGRTLVLVNSRRVVGSPSLGGGGTVNLNMIPFSAVDRVEVIADGASAVYGSDAVTGVVNVILKKNYEGMKISARYGDRDRDTFNEESFSILTGASSDRGSVTMGLEYDRRAPIFDADRSYTAARWSDRDGDGDILGYDETVGVSFYGYTVINPTYTGAAFDKNDPTTWYVHPGTCAAENGYIGPVKSDLVFGPDTGYYCGYAYALVSANRAGLKRINSWVSAEYELNSDIDLYADAIFSQNESFGRYAPPAAPGPTIPGDPRNTVGATFGYFRWTDIGFRDNTVNDNLTDINIGARGDIGDSVSWDVGYTYSNYTSSSVGTYYLSYAGLEYNISYNISDFDTFVANLKTTTLNDDRSQLQKLFAGVQFDMFDLPGGTATTYIAAEYYEIDYTALVDAQSEAGLVGGSAGNSAAGYRDVTAFSAEAILPVTDWLELDAAIRYDKYSDFGNATSPRLGATMRVPGFDALKLKASWGQGFRAPDLSDLYGATSFSAEAATDSYGCQLQNVALEDCPERQFDTYIGSNPNLDAEESETWSLGAEYTFMGDWVAAINYFNLTLKSSIEYTSAQDQLNVDFNQNGGNPQVQRNATGGVTRIDAGFQNGSTDFERNVLDYSIRGSYDTEYGTFGLAANASQYLNYDVEVTYGTGVIRDAVDASLGLPTWRTNVFLSWNMGNWFTNLNWDYIGESKSQNSTETWEGWDQYNLTVGYNMDDMGTVSVGAVNLTDEDPVLDANTGAPVEELLYPQVGRVWFVRYTIEM